MDKTVFSEVGCLYEQVGTDSQIWLEFQPVDLVNPWTKSGLSQRIMKESAELHKPLYQFLPLARVCGWDLML